MPSEANAPDHSLDRKERKLRIRRRQVEFLDENLSVREEFSAGSGVNAEYGR